MKIISDDYRHTDTPVPVPSYMVAYNEVTSRGNTHRPRALFYDEEDANAFAVLVGEQVYKVDWT